ncbi:MAG: hypothetical protein HFE62_03730 [Firmicutes bacterium]|nr:hypothetical protein [Bacillota bacterium]
MIFTNEKEGYVNLAKELKGSNGRTAGGNAYFDLINNSCLSGLIGKDRGRNRYYDLYEDIERNLASKKYSHVVSKYKITKNNCKKELSKMFEPVAKIIIRDILNAKKKDVYIKNKNAAQIITALNQLKLCGISMLDKVISKTNELNWYIDINENKVKQLQKLLNELGYGPLKENGIYDEKTDRAWTKFVIELETGDFIKMTNSQVSKANVMIESVGTLQVIEDSVNIFSRWRLNELSKNINGASKIVKVGRKTILVSSIALDALELGLAIENDLTDADKKIGKKTWSTAAVIGGSWVGYLSGIGLGTLTKLGVGKLISSTVGGALGSSVAGPAGTVAGATVSFFMCIILSDCFGNLGGYVVEIVIEDDVYTEQR